MLAVLGVVLSLVFLTILGLTKFLPWGLYIVICIVFLAICILAWILQTDKKHGVCRIIGCVLSVIMIVVSITGAYFINKAMNTLRSMTTEDEVIVTEMSVYVLNDNKAQTLNDCINYSVGIMALQDREVTDEAIEDLQEKLNCVLNTVEYEGPILLVKALLTKQVDAILFSPLFFDLVSANSDLEVEQMRQIATFGVTTPKVVAIEDGLDIPPTHIYDHDDVFTVYISGLDQNGSIENSVGNGDVNIIATVNVKTHEIALVSTPRDYYLELSNWDKMDKLTHAAFYGINCSMETLENLYDIDIDYFFRVNYTGFCQIIDAMGGIEVENDVEFTSDALSEPYYFPEGLIHLNGLDALAYVRCRHAFRLGDVTRGKHQVMVLKAVIERAMSWDVVSRYGEVMDVMGRSFETNIPLDIIAQLVQDQLNFGDEWHIVYYTTYGWTEARQCYSYGEQELSVMIPMVETVNDAKELMRQVREGEVAEELVNPE